MHTSSLHALNSTAHGRVVINARMRFVPSPDAAVVLLLLLLLLWLIVLKLYYPSAAVAAGEEKPTG